MIVIVCFILFSFDELSDSGSHANDCIGKGGKVAEESAESLSVNAVGFIERNDSAADFVADDDFAPAFFQQTFFIHIIFEVILKIIDDYFVHPIGDLVGRQGRVIKRYLQLILKGAAYYENCLFHMVLLTLYNKAENYEYACENQLGHTDEKADEITCNAAEDSLCLSYENYSKCRCYD